MAEKLGKTPTFTLILLYFGRDPLTPGREAAVGRWLQSRRQNRMAQTQAKAQGQAQAQACVQMRGADRGDAKCGSMGGQVPAPGTRILKCQSTMPAQHTCK